MNSLERLPQNAVVYFDGLAAVKHPEGWLLSGESTPVDSVILQNMSPVFHVISEYSYFPENGFDTHKVNLTHVKKFVEQYGEVPWLILFEWIRDFYGVELDTARGAVWQLINNGQLVPTDHETLKISY